ncbi:MAG: phosphoribosylaminoimidazolesuccinocarboxamide synthase [Alphaproteobacteria bacterium]
MNDSILVEGKTKIIEKTNDQNIVRIVTKDFLTGGDAAKKEEIKDIGIQKTKQTSNVFIMLSHAGIATSFIEQDSPNSLLSYNCNMLPLEFVVRRYAWGSYLSRNKKFFKDVVNPHQFKNLVWEIFHKEAVVMPPHVAEPVQMEEGEARRQFLKDGKWEEGVFTDPFVKTGEEWELFSAKKPITGNSLMKTKKLLSDEKLQIALNEIILPSFKFIEEKWKNIKTIDGPIHLVDIKFELGFKVLDNSLVLSDVVDNDSWRIWPGGNPNKQLDKQSFREGEELVNVANKYQLVTQLTDQFNVSS